GRGGAARGGGPGGGGAAPARSGRGIHMTRLIRRIVFITLLTLGAAFTVAATWIPVKAQVAQILLLRAWDRTRAGTATAKPWPWADTWPVGRLRVPRLGVDEIVLAGASGNALA